MLLSCMQFIYKVTTSECKLTLFIAVLCIQLRSQVYQLKLSGSRLPIQHSHTELQVTLILKRCVHLAAGLVHCSTSHTATALLIFTTLTDVSQQALCIVLGSYAIRYRQQQGHLLPSRLAAFVLPVSTCLQLPPISTHSRYTAFMQYQVNFTSLYMQ